MSTTPLAPESNGVLQPGARVTDSHGRTWIVGQQLGRGLWGTSWLLRSEEGRECVLKTPLTEADFPADAPIPDDLIALCRRCYDEQVKLLSEGHLPFLPRLDDQIVIEKRPAYLLPRYGSLDRQLMNGLSVRRLLLWIVDVAVALDNAGKTHGNLRATNVLINERGEPVLTDLLTATVTKNRERLARYVSAEESVPPEARAGGSALQPNWDTWALCLLLYRAVMVTPTDGNTPRSVSQIGLPAGGLDKMELASLKDRALARLKGEQSNPRFVGRLTERLASILNRGLSRQHEPSPPFRFQRIDELLTRLTEVAALIAPRVEEVGKLMLSAGARESVFEGGQPVGFSITVGASQGITDHEDIVCGVQFRDIDADGDGRIRLHDLTYSVSRHPSGRLRFAFTLPDVPPGRYNVRAAFAIKDGGREPVIAEGNLEVRPPPGYVPPAEDPEDLEERPLTFPGAGSREIVPEPDQVPTEQEAVDPFSEPGTVPGGDGELIEGVFPKPIAPPASGTLTGPPISISGAPPIPQPVQKVEVVVEPTEIGASDTSTPALAVPRPQIGIPTPPPAPSAQQPPPAAPQTPDWSGPGSWEPLPDPEALAQADLDLDPFFTSIEGEELPTWDTATPRQPLEWVEWLVTTLRKDSYTALVVGASLSMAVLILLMLTLKACAG